MAGDGDGGRNRDNDGMDGIASGGSIDSEWVKEVWLAGESQRMHQGQWSQNKNLPRSSEPPIMHTEGPSVQSH